MSRQPPFFEVSNSLGTGFRSGNAKGMENGMKAG